MLKRFSFILILVVNGILLQGQEIPDTSGYRIFYYPNGVKSSEGRMIDGQPEGWWKSYDEKGNLISEGNRRGAQLDGAWFFYNASGDTTLVIHYNNGLKEGKRIQFLSNERVVEEWQADTMLSPIRTYMLDGTLKRETPCVNGRPHGLEKEYAADGTIIRLAYYHHGILTKREQVNRTDNFGYKQGKWKYFWPNGNLKREGTYLNDKKNGFFKEYDSEGNFLYVQKWENDQLITDAQETKRLDRRVSYHSNGQVSIIATYFNDKAEGIRREFDQDGNLVRGYVFSEGVLLCEGITDMNGMRQGKWKEYYATGELKSEGTYKNSNRTGKWKFFFPDKSVEVVGSYDAKGRQQGEWQWFYANGQLMRTCSYDAGVLDGEYIEYDEEGTEVTKGVFEEGTEEGRWLYKRNNAIEEGSYSDGLRTGVWKTWYSTGVISSEIEYDQDLMNGKYTTYYENHVVKRSGQMVNGEQTGVWYEYNENAELLLTTLYKDGKEIKWNNYKIEY